MKVSAEMGRELKIQEQNIENIWLATVFTLFWELQWKHLLREKKNRQKDKFSKWQIPTF